MEKRAQIQEAGRNMRDRLRRVSDEDAYNIKAAAHNQRIMLGMPGDPIPYKNAEFRGLIGDISTLFRLALQDE